ncbi:MAG TPA: hypothetical protein VFE05_20270 [Longimicrobiaceae bacterium]|jgi:hypothetical protein|nr:hypothetical protein [Longimicrobiaceae bacterium]
MAVSTTDPIKTIEPQPWDPACPACRSGFGPPDPLDPGIDIALEPTGKV